MSNIITSVNTSVPIKGTGKTLGITNGTSNYGLTSGSGSNYISGRTDAYDVSVTSASQAATGITGKFGVTTDASKSGIVGTVTRTQITCKYIIKY